jgi:signal transduction histidine kinase
MRAFLTTLAPMLVAAALVIWGGERLARREVVSRTSADRERLHDFSASLRKELDRLDGLYLKHLRDLAAKAPYIGDRALAESGAKLSGTREIHVFQAGGKRTATAGIRPQDETVKWPEVELEGRKRPLVIERAVVLPMSLIDIGRMGENGVVAAPDRRHEVWWFRPDANHLVAVTVDAQERRSLLENHLAAWMEGPFAPLREAGELVAVSGPDEIPLIAPPAAAQRGPAALVMPHRNSLGEWQVQAWDRLVVSLAHDTATRISAAGVALLLVLSGAFLLIQQRRALRLAEERVSFVNRVSHELGTPLTNILLNLDLAAGSLAARPQETRRRLALVNEEAQRLARLVSNVLTFSRKERNQLELREEPCLPDEVMAGVLDQFRPSLDRRNVTVEWHGEALSSVLIDRDSLAQIVGNLISNVEKYAASARWMRITSIIEAGHLCVTVSDRGPGIPEHQRERIFEAFERVHRGVNEGSSGTGLGLAIARDLARRMGGDLTLESSRQGAMFRLTIPVKTHLEVVKPQSVA